MKHNRGTQNIMVPVQFHTGSYRLNWQTVRRGETVLFAGCWFYGRMENLSLGESWELVRSFLSVDPEDEQSVLDFLAANGQFKAPEGSCKSGVEISELQAKTLLLGEGDRSRRRPTYNNIVESFSLEEFATIQDYARRMLLSGNPTLPTPWETGYTEPYKIAFAGDRTGPKAHVMVYHTLPVILATIQFKLVQGARFRVCARKDCRLPFEITSRHKRRFCTQYCAHITSLRQRRKVGGKLKSERKANEQR